MKKFRSLPSYIDVRFSPSFLQQDVSFLDVSTSLGLLVKQLFNPEDGICQARAMEAFGDDWRSTLKKDKEKRKDAENIKKGLVDRY